MAGQRHASGGGGRRIVIVGGGPTAVAALTHLRSVSGIGEVTIASRNEIGLTEPFSPSGSRLICNTSLDVTSLDPDGPSDLLRYLAGRGWPVHREDFVPRHLVGSYARERYLAARDAMSRAGVRIRHERDEVRSVAGEPGAYRLTLTSGRVLPAGDVLLCTGGGGPFVPPALREHVGSPGVTVLPASPAELRAVPAGTRVLLLGSKLSAVDTALLLCPRGCRVVMASPSGQLPAVRTRLTRQPDHGFAARWQDRAGWAAETDIRRTVRELLRAARAGADGPSGIVPGRRLHALERLRAETERAAAGKVPWQDLVAEVIDAMNTVLPHWPAHDRERFLALHREAVSRYVSAIPERNARLLLHYADAGLLSLAGLCPERIDHEPGGSWRVKWQDGSASRFDHVVSAAGHRRPAHTVTASGELRLGQAPVPEGSPVRIGAGLRLERGAGRPPERIWALGSASWPVFPVVNYLRAAAQHARCVARQLAEENQA
ncbi:FAD/NAD(P)-binding protein [Streptomyces sp. MNU89]|uniref:FAD/NAD(P)-binding protein n=1 Tax=Streptomyces sp. MNU89 TaxID=2560025 RepID=UPI001E3BF3B9|nr:FAD/NAD(P)-binding domain-containing protein [Streptomyces sp. MNU89]MCC9738244.1 FAD/NAD(P)-binding protein [Streptomyces sp. MNU89]